MTGGTAAARRIARPFGIAGFIVAAALVLLANPFGVISPKAEEMVARLKQQLCVYDGMSYSIGSTRRVSRVVSDGAAIGLVDSPVGPVMRCSRAGWRARWEVISRPTRPAQ